MPSRQRAGTWGMLPVLLIVAVSGIFTPLAGLLVAWVLRRMARRQSGSQVQAARDAALQWVR